MICPLCKREYSSPPALSRTDNKTPICPRCGTREALETLRMSPEKIDGILDAIYGSSVENVDDREVTP
jgi:hypothetical protein